jgi:hypothetical protein
LSGTRLEPGSRRVHERLQNLTLAVLCGHSGGQRAWLWCWPAGFT